MGASHHFLRTRKNSQSSAMIESLFIFSVPYNSELYSTTYVKDKLKRCKNQFQFYPVLFLHQLKDLPDTWYLL
jgi:hypothetical protein